jgi:hypothetical protein
VGARHQQVVCHQGGGAGRPSAAVADLDDREEEIVARLSRCHDGDDITKWTTSSIFA